MLNLEAKYQAFARFVREKARAGSVENLLAATPSKLLLLFPELISVSYIEVNNEAGIVRVTAHVGPKDLIHLSPPKELFRFKPEAVREKGDDSLKELIRKNLHLPAPLCVHFLPLNAEFHQSGGFFVLVFPRDNPNNREVIHQVEELLRYLETTRENLILKAEFAEMDTNYRIIAKTLSMKKLTLEEEAHPLLQAILETATQNFQAPLAVLFRREGNTLAALLHFGTSPSFKEHQGKEEPLTVELYRSDAMPDTHIFEAEYYREKIEKQIVPQLAHSALNEALAIPLSPFGKHTYVIALFFDHLEEEKRSAYQRAGTLFSGIASSSIESRLNKSALSSATSALVQEKKNTSDLLNLTNLVSSTLNVGHSLSIVVKKVRELFDADRSSIIVKVHGKNEGVLQHSASRDHSIEEPVGMRINEQECPYFFSPARTKKPLIIDNTDSLKLNVKERGLMYALNIKKMLLLPIFNHGDFMGLLTVDHTQGDRSFSEGDISLLSAVANQISSAVGNASLFADVLKSKNEWELIFNSISDGVFVVDMDYTITNFNTVFANHRGFDPGRIIGRKCYELFACKKQQTEECGHVKCIMEKKPVESIHTYSKIPGTFRVTISPVFDERGEIEKSVHFIKDITKELEYKKQLEESLKKAQEISDYLETLIESTPDSIISTDEEGKIVYFSKGAAEVLGYSAEETQGKHVSEIYPSLEEARKIGQAMRKNRGKIRNYNVSLKKKDGTLVEVLLSASALYGDDGALIGTVGISKDLSKIKKMEEYIRQSEKLTALGKLASGIAHDFNNILAAISMRAELMKLKVEDSELLKELEIIENAAHTGAATVKKLRSFYKRDRKTFGPVNLNDVIREAVDITSPRWKDMSHSKGISTDITLSLDEELHTIQGNEGELKDVFINLIINALDAMPKGGKIRISTQNAHDRVKTVFTDSGVGMQPRIRDRAFEPFFSTKGEKGSGLGLSTVYGIITAHGGQVDLESWAGKGTSFILHLPISDPEITEGPYEDEEKDYDIAGTTVILFEDEEPIRNATDELLTEKGCSVSAFDNSSAGLKFLRENLTSLRDESKVVIITDLGMPAINGLEIARKAKDLDGRVPVIMLTGWGTFMEHAQVNIYGVDRIIPKPVKGKVLVRTIGELIS